jgi:hypothetical protein
VTDAGPSLGPPGLEEPAGNGVEVEIRPPRLVLSRGLVFGFGPFAPGPVADAEELGPPGETDSEHDGCDDDNREGDQGMSYSFLKLVNWASMTTSSGHSGGPMASSHRRVVRAT